MEYRINNFYPLQVWFLTILTAPVIIGLSLMTWSDFSMDEVTRTISFIGLGIAIGAALSLPTFAVYYLSFFLVVRSNISEAAMKLLLGMIAVAGLMTSFYVIGLDIHEFTMRDMVLPLSFFAGIVGYSGLFRIRKPAKIKAPAPGEEYSV